MTDADRFEDFVGRYQDMVFATAVRLVGREADAEDIAQAVFVKAWERFDSIGSSAAAPGWLKTVTTNLCLNHLSRYRSRLRLFSELSRPDDKDGHDADEEPQLASRSASVPPSDRLDREERQQQLERALRTLPDDQRVTLVLYHFEEQSYQEIAALLGVSLGKVKTDVHRGRQALRRWLEHDEPRARSRS